MKALLAAASVLTFAGCGYVATPAEPLKEGTEIARVAKGCARPLQCGALGYVDCNSALDGPAYYFERRSGRVVAYCGGSCMAAECRNCPPKAWSCGRRAI